MAAARDPLLDARVSSPAHVVRRSFPDETIVLNLDSGRYHALNATAAVIVDRLLDGATPAQVASGVAAEANEPVDRVVGDVLRLVRALQERGLMEVRGGGR
jgi:hypothetical protein